LFIKGLKMSLRAQALLDIPCEVASLVFLNGSNPKQLTALLNIG